MINYNLASLGETNLMMLAILFYIVIMFSFVIGNFISVKLLHPGFKNIGRMFYGALIWFCTHITISLFLSRIGFPLSFYWVSGLSLIAFYFETKFLFDYSWGKAILATLITLVVSDIVFFALLYLWPFVSESLVKLPFSI